MFCPPSLSSVSPHATRPKQAATAIIRQIVIANIFFIAFTSLNIFGDVACLIYTTSLCVYNDKALMLAMQEKMHRFDLTSCRCIFCKLRRIIQPFRLLHRSISCRKNRKRSSKSSLNRMRCRSNRQSNKSCL